MTIHLNLSPDEARELHRFITNRGGSILASVEAKLHRQAHRFATPVATTIPAANAEVGLLVAAEAPPSTLGTTIRSAVTKALAGRDIRYNLITAIKALREITSIGLGDAVDYCRNWDQFIAHVDNTGALPQPGANWR